MTTVRSHRQVALRGQPVGLPGGIAAQAGRIVDDDDAGPRTRASRYCNVGRHVSAFCANIHLCQGGPPGRSNSS